MNQQPADEILQQVIEAIERDQRDTQLSLRSRRARLDYIESLLVQLPETERPEWAVTYIQETRSEINVERRDSEPLNPDREPDEPARYRVNRWPETTPEDGSEPEPVDLPGDLKLDLSGSSLQIGDDLAVLEPIFKSLVADRGKLKKASLDHQGLIAFIALEHGGAWIAEDVMRRLGTRILPPGSLRGDRFFALHAFNSQRRALGLPPIKERRFYELAERGRKLLRRYAHGTPQRKPRRRVPNMQRRKR